MRIRPIAFVLFAALLSSACGDSGISGPGTEVTLGETTFVVLVNPTINAANGVTLPAPGSARSGVDVSWDAAAGRTDAEGVAVLGGVPSGTRPLSLTGGGLAGSVSASIAERDLREVAVALTNVGAAIMANVHYAFGGEVVDITPTTPLAEVNAHLARSNVIVLMSGGTYRGDLRFTGSSVTLFGAGVRGGEVTIDGSVTIQGSNNRVRGARVTGNLDVSGSGAGISFSRVSGAFSLSGSGAVLLNNVFCGQVSVAGSNPTLLGNAGLAPIPAASGGC
jgi:hypothetical protein